jgi:hypothetical protein
MTCYIEPVTWMLLHLIVLLRCCCYCSILKLRILLLCCWSGGTVVVSCYCCYGTVTVTFDFLFILGLLLWACWAGPVFDFVDSFYDLVTDLIYCYGPDLLYLLLLFCCICYRTWKFSVCYGPGPCYCYCYLIFRPDFRYDLLCGRAVTFGPGPVTGPVP